MTFGGDQWGRPQPTEPQMQRAPRRDGPKAMGCYLLVVGFLAVVTVISFAVSVHSTSPGLGTSGRHGSVGLMPWLFLILTVLVAVVPLLVRGIFRAAGTDRRHG